MIDLILELEQVLTDHPDESITLKKYIEGGVIDWRITFEKDVYLFHDAKMIEVHNKSRAIQLTADRFDISERQAYRIIKKMKPDE